MPAAGPPPSSAHCPPPLVFPWRARAGTARRATVPCLGLGRDSPCQHSTARRVRRAALTRARSSPRHGVPARPVPSPGTTCPSFVAFLPHPPAFHMAMAMQRAAALGACHILAASASASVGVISCRHMSGMDAGTAMEKIRVAGLLRTRGLIGGKWVDAYDGKTIEVQNPATGEVLANVACMGNKETSDAIASAHDTFYSWSKLTASERSKALRKWYDLIISHKEELALLMTLEQGKPMKEALGQLWCKFHRIFC